MRSNRSRRACGVVREIVLDHTRWNGELKQFPGVTPERWSTTTLRWLLHPLEANAAVKMRVKGARARARALVKSCRTTAAFARCKFGGRVVPHF